MSKRTERQKVRRQKVRNKKDFLVCLRNLLEDVAAGKRQRRAA